VEEFPSAPPRRPTVEVRRALAVIERRGRVLMVRREGRLLAGLWEPPGVELSDGDDPKRRLAALLGRLGVRARLVRTGRIVRHTITHHRIQVELWRGTPQGRFAARPGLRWIDATRPGVALTALARRSVSEKER
jgi:hypothetical protein